MIVETMTHEEVYREIERDYLNLHRWVERQCNECRRYSIKKDRKNFPIVLTDNYTSPRRIQYGLMVILPNKNGYYSYTYALRQTPHGKYVYLCKSYEDSIIPKVVFIPHAMKRYVERSGNDNTGEDLVLSMLIRTINCVVSRNQRIGSKSVRYKGEELITLCTREGAWLGKKEGDIFIVNTFITYDMTSGLQEEVLTQNLDVIKRGRNAADDLILKFNNRSTLRSNQPIKKRANT